MRKPVQVALAVLLVAIAGVLAWQVLGDREPVYQGKQLSAWLENYNVPKNDEAWRQADEAVRQIGTNAIPLLLQMLCRTDSVFWKQWLMELARKQHLVRIHYVAAWGQNWRAANALGALGAAAGNSVPELINFYDHPVSRPSRRYTAMALGKIGPTAKMAIPSLLQTASTSTDDDERLSAVFALGGIHADPELVLPMLIKCLSDPSVDVQTQAVEGLGDFGPDAKPALPALIRLLQNTNNDVVSQTRTALIRISPEAAARAGVK